MWLPYPVPLLYTRATPESAAKTGVPMGSARSRPACQRLVGQSALYGSPASSEQPKRWVIGAFRPAGTTTGQPKRPVPPPAPIAIPPRVASKLAKSLATSSCCCS